ncbi:MAG: hypothetical protein H7831_09100, partial [Magnetococcus sp. WYHC-3]
HVLSADMLVRLHPAQGSNSHADVREALWLAAGEDWEWRLGLTKVFWGVAEGWNPVDVINQRDGREGDSDEDKLGQPLAQGTLIRPWGTVDLLWLPWFRPRTFPGVSQRLRPSLPVATDRATYASAAGTWAQDVAVRYRHNVGVVDLGLSAFHGTQRDPELRLGLDAAGQPWLVPHYPRMTQLGVDVQATLDSWLWKLESAARRGDDMDALQFSGGFEYTFVGIGGTDKDLGVIGELMWDERGALANHPFQGDMLTGLRLVFNDEASSEVLLGVIQDLDHGGAVVNLESSTRWDDHWKVALDGRAYINPDPRDMLYGVRNDHYVKLELSYHF